MKKIEDIKNLRGKKVILRLDLNIPMNGGKILDAHRIERSRKTLDFLADTGARTIIIAHTESGEKTLVPVFDYLQNIIKVKFAGTLEEAYKEVETLREGCFLLLENLRNYEGEKGNDFAFCERLAHLGEIYINDAFSVSHRPHASIVGITEFLPSYAGFLFQDEIINLSKAFRPDHPFLFILGGAKFETKVHLVKRFLDSADSIFIGGALSNDFFKEKGYEIGQSKFSEDRSEVIRIMDNKKIILPRDIVAFDGMSGRMTNPQDVRPNETILDSGNTTMHVLEEEISKAKFVVWNGPLGEYERGFDKTTLRLAVLLAEATKRGSKTIVGGGDTVAALSKLKLEKDFTFISMGGGAMIDYLGNGTLPGIEALENSKK